MSEFLIRIARRGYGWYVALKMAKAISLPLFVTGWIVYSILVIAFVFSARVIAAICEVVAITVGDFRYNVLRRRWFTGFSRAHYLSLEQYVLAKEPAP